MASSCAGFYHDATEQNHGARQGNNRQIPSVTGRTSLLPRLLQWHIPGWLPRKEIMRTYEVEPVCYAGQ